MFTDTHCHLTTEKLRSDIEGIVSRATARQVNRIITAGTDYETSIEAIELSNKYSSIFATAGLHPEESMELSIAEIDEEIDSISDLLQNPKVLAVGEIGADQNWIQHMANEKKIAAIDEFKEVSLKKQFYALEKQLELALQNNLPVVIHCRDAEKELFETLQKFTKNGGHGILHSYTGDPSFMEHFVSLGWYVSFNGIVTFKNGQNVRDLCTKVPTGQILLETDAPFLAPEPYRGEVCEPQYIVEIANKVAEIKDISVGDLEGILEDNFQNLFG